MENDNLKFDHIPVMLGGCIDGLNIKKGKWYVDGTMGGGGHSSEILAHGGKLIGIDKDDVALNHCKVKFANCKDVQFVKGDFKNFKQILANLGIGKVDGILLDLGVSSYQIDTPERGFSYRFDAPLDMRMDTSCDLTAFDVVNNYSEQQLLDILYNYGEEVHAKLIVRGILQHRAIKPIKTTSELVEIIESSIPRKFWGKGSMAKRTFQSIRIEVNGELTNLDSALRDMAECLNSGGRLVVITFHSLEDRIVKNLFKELSSDCICDKSLPFCVCKHKAIGLLVNKKPLVASDLELNLNKRSSSAKVRIFEKF